MARRAPRRVHGYHPHLRPDGNQMGWFWLLVLLLILLGWH